MEGFDRWEWVVKERDHLYDEQKRWFVSVDKASLFTRHIRLQTYDGLMVSASGIGKWPYYRIDFFHSAKKIGEIFRGGRIILCDHMYRIQPEITLDGYQLVVDENSLPIICYSEYVDQKAVFVTNTYNLPFQNKILLVGMLRCKRHLLKHAHLF